MRQTPVQRSAEYNGLLTFPDLPERDRIILLERARAQLFRVLRTRQDLFDLSRYYIVGISLTTTLVGVLIKFVPGGGEIVVVSVRVSLGVGLLVSLISLVAEIYFYKQAEHQRILELISVLIDSEIGSDLVSYVPQATPYVRDFKKRRPPMFEDS